MNLAGRKSTVGGWGEGWHSGPGNYPEMPKMKQSANMEATRLKAFTEL